VVVAVGVLVGSGPDFFFPLFFGALAVELIEIVVVIASGAVMLVLVLVLVLALELLLALVLVLVLALFRVVLRVVVGVLLACLVMPKVGVKELLTV